jgi:hypothetical protein
MIMQAFLLARQPKAPSTEPRARIFHLIDYLAITGSTKEDKG